MTGKQKIGASDKGGGQEELRFHVEEGNTIGVGLGPIKGDL